jgi:post-segregation antitoxin (ccd killing protein)
MAKILTRAREGSNLSEWGYTQIQTAQGGVGLVRSGFGDYEPTLDMTGLALRLAAALQRGRYIAEPEIRAEVPANWFQKERRSDAEQLLTKARAAISVTGTLRRGVTAEPSAQQFTQWVVEMPGAAEANSLVQYVGGNARLGSRFVVGVASGRLFSLLVAGSFVDGVEPFESAESLAAIANETQSLLGEAAR